MEEKQYIPEEKYMRRALELAVMGAGRVSPNPMVGAVIVAPDGRIIGEGFHRKYGEAHAEVNAYASVSHSDEHLLKESIIYVTLEPCSHYGKTPPCAELICRRGIKRAVIGVKDPNPKVAGRGIAMLREAGIEVIENFLEDECEKVNRRFLLSQRKRRPWIILKWAETADGYMSRSNGERLVISNPVTMELMHRERALCDAILVGTDTILSDNPSLTVRLWPGRNPRPVIFDSSRLKSFMHSEKKELHLLERNPIILNPAKSLEENMHLLFREHGVTSLMVEGGSKTLQSFIDAGLYDEVRRERSTQILGPEEGGAKAPSGEWSVS